MSTECCMIFNFWKHLKTSIFQTNRFMWAIDSYRSSKINKSIHRVVFFTFASSTTSTSIEVTRTGFEIQLYLWIWWKTFDNVGEGKEDRRKAVDGEGGVGGKGGIGSVECGGGGVSTITWTGSNISFFCSFCYQ